MGVRFVVDSTADLDADYQRQHQIAVVPLRVIFGDEELRDYVDIGPDDFYKRMQDDSVVPRTSQPTPAEFESAFRQASDDGSTVICTTISADLSGTWNSAMSAKEALPDRDIRIVDTRSVSVGHNAIVHAAIAHAESGANPDNIVARIESIKAQQRLVFTLETLEYLRRGGRIGGAQALMGSLLNIKPVLTVEDGKVDQLGKVRTFPRAIDRLLEELESSMAEWGSAKAVVGHAANPEAAAGLAERASRVTGDEVPVIWVGPVIGCHGGPGAIGFGFYKP